MQKEAQLRRGCSSAPSPFSSLPQQMSALQCETSPFPVQRSDYDYDYDYAPTRVRASPQVAFTAKETSKETNQYNKHSSHINIAFIFCLLISHQHLRTYFR